MADPPDVRRVLGQAVKRIRAERGLTQEELSSRTGLHPTYISDIERGARNPSFETIVRLAAGLEVPVARIAAAYDDLAS
jgi:transcriptional regulator with XRE-family HTH domain